MRSKYSSHGAARLSVVSAYAIGALSLGACKPFWEGGSSSDDAPPAASAPPATVVTPPPPGTTPPPGPTPPPGATPPPVTTPPPGSTPPPPAPPPSQSISDEDAARFLLQASFGASSQSIAQVKALGYEGWIDAQFDAPPFESFTAWIRRGGPANCTSSGNISRCITGVGGFDYPRRIQEYFLRTVVEGGDELRMRTVYALSQIMVASFVNNAPPDAANAAALYYQALYNHAFGNYRDALEDVSMTPFMAFYLTHWMNQRSNGVTQPDENYAREVMQLFSVGLFELNMDGSRRLDANGAPIETYTQEDVRGMARVFTGLASGCGREPTLNNWNGAGGFCMTSRMQFYDSRELPAGQAAGFYERGEKRLLNGVVIPANTPPEQSLDMAMDALVNHPSAAPFLAHALIQRFTTSNPSPAYIQRVAQAFANNGQGVRGDMRAVIKAILLDPEARANEATRDPNFGKLKEPFLKWGQYMRTYRVRTTQSGVNRYFLNDFIDDPTYGLNQRPFGAPSVFNFYFPDFSPQGAIQGAGLVSPEFQLNTEIAAIGYTNWVSDALRGITNNGVTFYNAFDLQEEMNLASNPAQLVDRIAMDLTAGALSANNRTAIIQAVEAVPLSATDAARDRARVAIALIMATPEFSVLR